MKYRAPLIGLSLFVVLSTVLTTMVFATLRRDVAGPTDTYYAVFTDASGMREGDDVRMAGVRVGRVESVGLEGLNAKVKFRVQHDQTIFGNTTASVTYQNIVGQRYLGLSLGQTGERTALRPGSVIPVERTTPSFDIGLLLNGFEPLFGVLDPQKIDSLTTALVDALQGNEGSITTLVEQSGALAETLAGRDEVLGDLIDELSSVIANLAQQNDNIRTVLAKSEQLITQLNDRRQELMTNAGSIAAVVRRLSQIAETVRPEFDELIRRQPGFAKHMTDIEPELAFLGNNLPLAILSVANAFQHGSYVNLYACELDITFIPGTWQVLPTIVNAATPGGKPMYSPKCRTPQ